MKLSQKLAGLQKEKKTHVCVGLDPDLSKMPAHLTRAHSSPDAILAFNQAIVEVTAPYACAYKLNFAFYEALGSAGWKILEQTLSMLPDDVISIADAKRGDIGNTGLFYAQAIFDRLGFDTCTVSPYMGMDSIDPFLQFEDRLAFVLARTSNPGASDLQEKIVGDVFVYEILVERLTGLPTELVDRLGLVVGATDVESLRRIRQLAPKTPFLIPGIGAQGGDVKSVVEAAYAGPGSIVINSSRAIIYADSSENFAEAARLKAKELRDEIWGVLA